MKPKLLSYLVVGLLAVMAGRISAPQTNAESQWVTVIRDNKPVWVELEPSFPNALTASPTAIVPISTATPTRTPTAQAISTAAATRTNTPSVTPTMQTPALATITPYPTNSPVVIACDVYPCRAFADDFFIPDFPFRFRWNTAVNIRTWAGIGYDPIGAKTTIGTTVDVWSIILKGAGPNAERWACFDNQKDCRRWAVVQGDLYDPFGVLEVYAVDLTAY